MAEPVCAADLTEAEGGTQLGQATVIMLAKALRSVLAGVLFTYFTLSKIFGVAKPGAGHRKRYLAASVSLLADTNTGDTQAETCTGLAQ